MRTTISVGLRVAVDVAQRLVQDQLGDRLEVGRHLDPVGPVDAQLGAALDQPLEQFAEAGLGRARRGLQRPGEGAAQVGDDRAQLLLAARRSAFGEVLVGAERQGDAEEPLDRVLVQVAGQLDPFGEAALAFALLGRVLDAGGQRGEPAERHHRLPLAVVEREVLAFAVGEDHPEPAPRGADRRAGQVGALRQLGVAGGHVLGEVAVDPVHADLDHPVLLQRLLGDRRLVDRPADPFHQLRRDPAGADRDHRTIGLVVQQQHRPLHRGQRHHRLAHPVVEDPRFGRLVEFGEQPDEHLDRPGTRCRRRRSSSPGAHLHHRDYDCNRSRSRISASLKIEASVVPFHPLWPISWRPRATTFEVRESRSTPDGPAQSHPRDVSRARRQRRSRRSSTRAEKDADAARH